MKKLFIIFLLLTCGICSGQNLVPNGDFEQYDGCPGSFGLFDSVSFWFNPTLSSPDYFNHCSNGTWADVPSNYFGYQPAKSGVGYGGMYIWYGNAANYREYIEVPLSLPLISNECYYLEMFINLSNNMQYTTDAIGAYFSDTLVTDFSTYFLLPFVPQIQNLSSNIPDTVNWTLVSGSFTANGGESYLIIGNFKNDSNIIVTPANNSGENNVYVYIEDVSLSLCTGIEEQNEIANQNIYPNPFNDKLTFRNKNDELSEIILYDITSRKIMQNKFTNSVSLNTEQLAKGMYLYEVRNKDGLCKKGKVVKEF